MSDIHPTQHPLDGKLEPETKDCFDDRAPLYSIAISLKRIADSLDTVESALLRIAQDSFDKWQIVDGLIGQVIHRKEMDYG